MKRIPIHKAFTLVFATITILAISFSCSSEKSEFPFDGVWKSVSDGNGDVKILTYFDIQQNEDGMEGVIIISDAVELEMEKVVVTDSMASFTMYWGADYILYPKGKELEVHESWGGSEPKIRMATRVKPSEIIPPDSLPLPELREVPSNGLALTPPMGWNSWNHFASTIDDSIVRGIADAMVSSGMAAAGYEYVVIDDGWVGGRDKDGNLVPNDHFPDIKALADYVHGLGLKLGIYSSPGPKTCGGYIGSYRYEEQDAQTFADWGIDYLKYDWCGAMRVYGYSRDNMQRAYQKMAVALQEAGRPIVYSICQYGLEDVWEWGAAAGGNLWRTTGDINDSWGTISNIGFGQADLAAYAKPGHWNDPDMLEVGNGDLTYAENKAHFTLWCMLSAPLMAGNDLRNMSEETIAILTNADLIAINQDELGKQAKRILNKEGVEVWSKPLKDGSTAIALFNRDNKQKQIDIDLKEINMKVSKNRLYDVWMQEDLTIQGGKLSAELAAHGVALFKARD
jgi:alpha-galactosidase